MPLPTTDTATPSVLPCLWLVLQPWAASRAARRLMGCQAGSCTVLELLLWDGRSGGELPMVGVEGGSWGAGCPRERWGMLGERMET